ncbi:uncharacterized protein N7477_002686 [Penicillium maclennaniae]|uniref:uncharacterized protein n=1 Tax=Penicillium maclennaniae TaxID=1343394 RepID=UPI00253FC862|nr:uncharacterized protein N7477_002686 [Penicillium maclennaniae]KAJ5677053.1 hypothetical protein N7477_002686 [Penicillium maclennaniae]
MQLQIRNLPALDLCHATAEGWVNRVESLLVSGVDPNARFDDSESALSGLADDKAHIVKATRPPQFDFEATEMPALRRAARDSGVQIPEMCDLLKTERLMTILLKYGADPYALFRQPIYSYNLVPIYPGDTGDPEYDDDESDLNCMRFARWGIIEKTLRLEYERLGLLGEKKEPGSRVYGFGDNYEECIDYKPRFPHKYGACSVIHSLLEDGAFIQPILNFLGTSLDVERRDPQGRTLFLAACRSKLGLDGAVDGAFVCLWGGQAMPNPYPQPRNPWQEESQRFTSTCTGPSLLEFFVSRGVNLLAVDKYGQNALHHLLAFIDRDNDIPPLINTSLKYLAQNCPSVLNQPDGAGFYPLHYAIRRMCDYPYQASSAFKAIFHFETAIYDLLDANADPLVRDGHGNTVLHYLAAGRLGEGDRVGDKQRCLLSVFLERGVDPKARNTAGVTALELLFMIKDEPMFESEHRKYDRFYAIGQEVVSRFEQGGYILTETNAANQSLLHLVAKLDSAVRLYGSISLKTRGSILRRKIRLERRL